MASQDSNYMANGTRMPGSEMGENSFISGINNAANAPHSAAIGSNNEVKLDANSAVALGDHSVAYSPYQLVHGRYNKYDANNIYAHIIGGGIDEHNRKNIYTLDWNGNATFAGKVSFAGDIEPTEKNDLVNLKYLNDQIAIKFFPHVLSEDGLKSTIYVNDLEAYTIYKVKREGQAQVSFSVRTESGRDITFYVTDLSINRYSMFVGDKTEDSITFFLNSSIFTIDLKTGRLTKAEDQTSSKPDAGTGGSASSDKEIINDGEPSANTTWSSDKISNILSALESQVSDSVNKIEIKETAGEYTLFFYNERIDEDTNETQREVIGALELPMVWSVTEQHLKEWNRVHYKVTVLGQEGEVGGHGVLAKGEPGQILAFGGINEKFTYNDNEPEEYAKWIYAYEDDNVMINMGIEEPELNALLKRFNDNMVGV